MEEKKIKIRILDVLSSKEVTADVPMSASIQRLMPVLVTKMNLPLLQADGQVINYRLFRNKTAITLANNDTLASVQCDENELFVCIGIPGEHIIEAPDEEISRQPVEIRQTKLEQQIKISAPIYIPSKEDIAVKLVKGETVYELERCRSDEMKFTAIMWTFVGATFGIIINWITSTPIIISTASIVAMSIFLIMSGLMWTISNDFRKRADKVNFEINRAFNNSRPIN